jgi:hypothetical protein
MAAPVGIAAHQVRERRHALVHPCRAMRIEHAEHPVADGERVLCVEQRAGQSWNHAGADLALAVVQAQRLAVQHGQAHQLAGQFGQRRLGGAGGGAAGQCGRESHRAQSLEIEVDHGGE